MKGKWAESDTLLDINDISGQIIGRSGWMDGWMDLLVCISIVILKYKGIGFQVLRFIIFIIRKFIFI